MGLRFDLVQAPGTSGEALSRLIAANETLLLDLTGDAGATLPAAALRSGAASRTAAAPCVVIIDEGTLDYVGALLEVPNLFFLAWPAAEAELSATLRALGGAGQVRDAQLLSGAADLGQLRSEVEQVAKTLAALVEEPVNAQPAADRDRSADASARLLRDVIRKRRVRADFFPAELFADPAWDILLDLAAARHKGKPVSVSSLCIAAAVPTTTGLRWIKALTGAGLLERAADPHDARRSFITLTAETAEHMERYLDVAA